MTVPRTDLALEAAEDLTAAGRFAALGSGVSKWECVQGGCPVTHIRVRDRDAAEALGRPVQMCAGAEVIQDLILQFDRRLAEREKLLENMRDKLDQAHSIVTEKNQQIIRLAAERQQARCLAICGLGGFVLPVCWCFAWFG